jgi:hypothetical protein
VQFKDIAQLSRSGAAGDGVEPAKLLWDAGMDSATDIAGLEQLM